MCGQNFFSVRSAVWLRFLKKSCGAVPHFETAQGTIDGLTAVKRYDIKVVHRMYEYSDF